MCVRRSRAAKVVVIRGVHALAVADRLAGSRVPERPIERQSQGSIVGQPFAPQRIAPMHGIRGHVPPILPSSHA